MLGIVNDSLQHAKFSVYLYTAATFRDTRHDSAAKRRNLEEKKPCVVQFLMFSAILNRIEPQRRICPRWVIHDDVLFIL